MSKQLFDEVIGDVPPSTVDVAAIVAAERRTRVIWRSAITTTAVVGLVAGLATGMVTGGPRSPYEQAGPPGWAVPSSTGEPTSDPTSPPPPPLNGIRLVVGDGPGGAETARRLTEVLREAMAAHVPGLVWIPDGRAATLTYRPDSVAAAWFTSTAFLSAGGRRGGFNLSIYGGACTLKDSEKLPDCAGDNRQRTLEGMKMFALCRAGEDCTATTTAAGAKAWIKRHTNETPLGALVSYLLYVEVPGDRMMEFYVGNYYPPQTDPAGPVMPDGALQPEPVMTEEQLLAVGGQLVAQIIP